MPRTRVPFALRQIALAVECFHKASLIHDDIVDGQDLRYGRPALYRETGPDIAMNAGDLLIGEGYRLLAECDLAPELSARMLRVAACGHRNLCLGQGEELEAVVLSRETVLGILRWKTAPAFNVALSLGAIAARSDETTLSAVQSYCDALGIAYQIQDDLADVSEDGGGNEGGPAQFSIVRQLFEEFRKTQTADAALENARESARRLLDEYRAEAFRAIRGLRQTALKSLLHRLCTKILSDG